MSKGKVYVSGKMSGLKDLNQPMFESAKDLLEKAGYEVSIPHDLTIETAIKEPKDVHFLGRDLYELSMCDYIFMLPDWEESKGARMELFFALSYGIKVLSHTHDRIKISQAPLFEYKVIK